MKISSAEFIISATRPGNYPLNELSEIAFAQDPDSGNLIQIQPLLIHREGYRPLAWIYEATNGDINTDISGVSIGLVPKGQEVTGTLSGRLVLDGEPAKNVVIGAGSVGQDKSSVGMPGAIAVTDEDGLFRIENLSAGSYFLQAGFLPGDGIYYPDQPGNVARAVISGETTDVGDLLVLNEINLYCPALGGSYAGASVIFPMSWSEVPGAFKYQVFVDQQYLAETMTNRLDRVEDFSLSSGLHVWLVMAFNAQDEIVGSAENQVTFQILGPVH